MPEVNSKVTLVQHTPNPEELIASAAKLCYASNTNNILEQEKDKAESFIEKLIKMEHMSPIEHISFTFYIEGVSRAMTHQLVRHRISSFSQRSQRYVNHEEFDYVIPPQIKNAKATINGIEFKSEEYFKETMEIIANRYKVLNSLLGETGEKSNEDARYILPNACETKIFVTMNARSLLHFFEERCCQRAQWEIRGVANKMLEICKVVCPSVFKNAGAKCIRQGKCPEGNKGCKKEKIQ
jgi:thymidylate synthase (FAD)